MSVSRSTSRVGPHGIQALALLALLTSAGCAQHLSMRPLELPIAGAAAPTTVLVSARLTFPAVARALNPAAVDPWVRSEKSAIARWSLRMQLKSNPTVQLHGRHICWIVLAEGTGKIKVMSQDLVRPIRGSVRVCASPRLSPSGELIWRDLNGAGAVRREAMALTSGVLLREANKWLGGEALEQLQRQLLAEKMSLDEGMRRLVTALTRPKPMSGGRCWRWNAEAATVGQPVAAQAALRLPIEVRVRPAVSARCEAPSSGAVRTEYTLHLEQRRAQLSLPVKMNDAPVAAALPPPKELQLAWGDGRALMDDWRAQVARDGALVLHGRVKGQHKTSCLGLPCRRALRGRVALSAGIPLRPGADTDLQLLEPMAGRLPKGLRRALLSHPNLRRWRRRWSENAAGLRAMAEKRASALLSELVGDGRAELKPGCDHHLVQLTDGGTPHRVHSRCSAWVVLTGAVNPPSVEGRR